MKKLLTFILIAILSVGCILGLTACENGKDIVTKSGLVYTKNDDGGYVLYNFIDDKKEVTELDLAKALVDQSGDATAKFVQIKKGAFNNNETLKKLVIPTSVTKIDAGALEGMKALEELTIPFVGSSFVADAYPGQNASGTNNAVGNEKSFGYIFGTEEYEGGAQISLTISEATTYYIPATLTKLNIVCENEYNIPIRAFNGLTQISSITFNEKVVGIGEEAFANCVQFTSFNIPKTVKTIYKGAFSGCTKLEKIVYGGNATDWASVTLKEDWNKNVHELFKVVDAEDNKLA